MGAPIRQCVPTYTAIHWPGLAQEEHRGCRSEGPVESASKCSLKVMPSPIEVYEQHVGTARAEDPLGAKWKKLMWIGRG